MSENFLRPMIDGGSSRVFDCNGTTMKLREEGDNDSGAFFQNSCLNNMILIKHSILPEEQRFNGGYLVGTKLYIPFNENKPYAGGRTIFVHNRSLEEALQETCGLSRLANKAAFDQDLRLLHVMSKLPTLDAFLLRDALTNEGISVNAKYLEISEQQWLEIETFIQDRFVPLVRAAVPDAANSRDRALHLVETMWAAKDLEALRPLVEALRLPDDRALEIFYAWKVITFYAYQYHRLKVGLSQVARWLKDSEAVMKVGPAAMRGQMDALYRSVKSDLREQWQAIDGMLANYESGYQKMFIDKTDATPFLSFLRDAHEIFWRLGDAIGKIDHLVYCWEKLTRRHPARQLYLDAFLHALGVFGEILASGKPRGGANAMAV